MNKKTSVKDPGHSFYVFVNAETDQVNVVYKRKGNTYGLLEPEK